MEKQVKVGLLFLGAFIISALFIINVKDIEFKDNHYRIYTYFKSVSGIENKSFVKLAGYKIGKVENIIPEVENNRIKVVFKIQNNVKIRKDATVKLQMENIMGAKHIAVSFGKSNDYLKNNDYIRNEEEIDLDKLIVSVTETSEEAKKMIKDFNVNQKKLISKVYQILNENQDKVRNFITNLDSITQESKPKINRIIKYLDKSMPDLKKTVHNIEKITYNLKNSKGSLGKIINHPEMYNELLDAVKNMKGSFNEIQSLVVRNDDNIDSIIFGIKNSIEPAKKSFENIADITQKIKKGEGTIGKLVSDTELYETAKNTIDKVSENLEDQREQSIMSSFTNSILGIFKF